MKNNVKNNTFLFLTNNLQYYWLIAVWWLILSMFTTFMELNPDDTTDDVLAMLSLVIFFVLCVLALSALILCVSIPSLYALYGKKWFSMIVKIGRVRTQNVIKNSTSTESYSAQDIIKVGLLIVDKLRKFWSLIRKGIIAIFMFFLFMMFINIFSDWGLFWTFIKKGVVPILKSIPITCFFAVILAGLHSFVEIKWFPIDTKGSKLCRQNAAGYYIWSEFIENLKPVIVLLWLFLRYNILLVTMVVVLIDMGFNLVFTVYVLATLKKRIQVWREDEIWQSKRVCTYLSIHDFGPYTSYSGTNIESMLEKSNTAYACRMTKNMIWESERMVICPHWIYREYFSEEEDRTTRFLFLTSGKDRLNGIMEQDVTGIIGEFIAAEKDVAVYISENDTDQIDIILSYPVIRLYEKKQENDKVVLYLTGGENMVTVPYFASSTFTHAYPRSQVAIMKYDYIDEELRQIVKLDDSTECFYRLLKVVEYVWHYRALAILAQDREKCRVLSGVSFKSSLGLWEKYQNREKDKYRDQETVQAYRTISNLLDGNVCGKTRVSYPELCQIITQLRNRYVGHGTMAFSVSQELLDAVKQLAGKVLKVFYSQEELLVDEHDMFTEQIPLVRYNVEGRSSLWLLAGYTEQEEYLDYKNAAFRSDKTKEYRLDYRGNEK